MLTASALSSFRAGAIRLIPCITCAGYGGSDFLVPAVLLLADPGSEICLLQVCTLPPLVFAMLVECHESSFVGLAVSQSSCLPLRLVFLCSSRWSRARRECVVCGAHLGWEWHRPHPILWRVVVGMSILYLMFLSFLLFQTVHDARTLMTYLPSLLPVFVSLSCLIPSNPCMFSKHAKSNSCTHVKSLELISCLLLLHSYLDPCRNIFTTCGEKTYVGAAEGKSKQLEERSYANQCELYTGGENCKCVPLQHALVFQTVRMCAAGTALLQTTCICWPSSFQTLWFSRAWTSCRQMECVARDPHARSSRDVCGCADYGRTPPRESCLASCTSRSLLLQPPLDRRRTFVRNLHSSSASKAGEAAVQELNSACVGDRKS